ncbi:MAG: ABC-F family ATP-binding cassette domain-containing protein [Clostridia bacterium]|nr:ABC-F family ATP-binding cassette domain-containing protein [Clostridia bacterium]
MALLTAYGLCKSFGEKQIFSDLSFEVQRGDRIGLVGVNGSGKTTLFRILSGEEAPTAGSVSLARLCRIALLEQSPDYPAGVTLYEETLRADAALLSLEERLKEAEAALSRGEHGDALIRRHADLNEAFEKSGGLTYRSRTRAALLALGFSEEELARPIATMSGGQMRKAALARALLSGADLLLLDEPTNHLDIAAIEWLESALRDYRGACVVVSHDRYFLDAVTTRTFELKNGRMHTANLPYSRYVELKLDRREIEWRHYRRSLREIKRIEGIIEQQRRWNQARNYVTIASKQKQIDRLRAGLAEPEREPDEIRFRLRAETLACSEVIACHDLSMRFDGKPVFERCDFMLRRDECVVLIGANGCGKTTFLNILLGRLEPAGGSCRLGAGVRVGYFAQSALRCRSERTVIEEMQDRFPRCDQTTIRNLLGAFLFRGDEVFKRMDALSGGEMARIQLLTLMLQGSNLLLLDEPTNHLDIASCEALERALEAYGGAMLIVTHDRYLANRLADRIVVMGYNGMEEFCGDWDQYRAALAERAEPDRKPAREKNGYLLSRERRAALSRAQGALKRAEAAVAEGEAEMRRLEEVLSAPENASDAEALNRLCGEMETLRVALERRYADWEAAEKDCMDLTEGEDRA